MKRATVLVAVGFALLELAWLFCTPLQQTPDEDAHYLRALTITQGRLLGPRVPLGARGEQIVEAGGGPAERLRWTVADTRGIVVPASLSPPGEACINTGRPEVRGSCPELTYTGDYMPVAYLLPAAGIAAAGDWQTAMWLGRAGSMVGAALFVMLAIVVTGGVARWRLVGLLAATPPTVLFISATTNPSGMEMTANLAFVASLLRLRREGEAMPAWCWAGLALSGAATILAWQLGVVFALLDVLACGALAAPTRLRAIVRAPRHRAGISAAALLAAVIAFVVWDAVSGFIHPSNITVSQGFDGLGTGVGQIRPVLQGAVGVFGLLNVFPPTLTLNLWLASVGVLMLAGFVLGSWRNRLVLLGASLVGVFSPALLYAFAYQFSGFGLQGRYVLPAMALIPMIAAECVDHGLGTRRVPLTATLSTRLARLAVAWFALWQLFFWWWNAKTWAGTNALVRHHAVWAPPAGWAPWLLAAVLGTAAVLAGDLLALLPGRTRASGGPLGF